MGSISIATFESTDSEPCQDFGVKKKDRERDKILTSMQKSSFPTRLGDS